MNEAATLSWLVPSLLGLLLYGLGQGLVKQWIGDVSPARYCLYYILANTIVNVWYFYSHPHVSLLDPLAQGFVATGVLAYLIDGAAWIFYFLSIAAGPVAIVGTLSAAYPALTVLFARVFLHEQLAPMQYVAVLLVIGGCIGLSYSHSASEDTSSGNRRWIPLALAALLFWGTSNTLIKFAYTLPLANQGSFALCSSIGGGLTLGLFGLLRGSKGPHTVKQYVHSLVPMLMMAGGSLGIIVASATGPISIVTPLIGAYPVVTVVYAGLVLKERITRLQYGAIGAIIAGVLMLAA
jgi:drug/metabolite transporter (DMT)-like permease